MHCRNPNIGLNILYFTVMIGCTHVGAGLIQGCYNPGLFVSLFGNVLLGLVGVGVLHQTGDIVMLHVIMALIAAILIHVAIIVIMKVLMRNQTPSTG